MPVKKSLSSVQRTLRELRNQGCICDITEKFNPYGGPIVDGKRVGIRQDLFGFIDLIALAPGKKGAIGIQCCTGSALAAHRQKILENENAPEWLRSGNPIELWAWRKILKKRGGKQMIWQPRIEEITMDSF